jgi:hypothetical protein
VPEVVAEVEFAEEEGNAEVGVVCIVSTAEECNGKVGPGRTSAVVHGAAKVIGQLTDRALSCPL